MRFAATFAGLVFLCLWPMVVCAEGVRLAATPALSPDGKQIAISWRGDLWMVDSEGGAARRLTTHPARDAQPAFSPDGKRLAFVSDRTGSPQVYVMDLPDGTPEQRTFHSEGCLLEEWYPDGRGLLTTARRDHFWDDPDRFFRVDAARRAAERMLFDDYGSQGRLSADGKRLLFVREGERPWRKGYRGSRAAQVWMYDVAAKTFEKLMDDPTGARDPLWTPDGEGFYFTSERGGSRNLWHFDLRTKKPRQLTHLTDDLVMSPCISRDGSTIVFAHLFDLYVFRPADGKAPERLEITCPGDQLLDPTIRRTLNSATDAAFSPDGLEIAMIAGGDLWVMDTELREPRQVTNTPEEERDPVFAPDGKSILLVSDQDGQSDVWRVTRADEAKYWWENEHFTLARVTLDPAQESDLRWSPDGKQIALLKDRGDLWVMGPDGKKARRVMRSATPMGFDWSPDGRWFVCGAEDAEYNRDIWIVPVDGSRKPVNVSRHPDEDQDPVWSPDGKYVAFTGRRVGDEVDICIVALQKNEDETSGHDRVLDRAKEKMAKARGKGKGKEAAGAKKAGAVAIDFDGIDRRVRRVSLPGTAETNLFWSHDSKQLAFAAQIDGKRGTYTISPPENFRPRLLSPQTGRRAKWIAAGNQIVWLAGGVPASLSATGAAKAYPFSVVQEVDRAKRNQAAFDQCWRTMRDCYYDAALGNHNWDEIRRKYADAVAASVDADELTALVNLMLGELNGSHLGFMTWDRVPPQLRMPGMPGGSGRERTPRPVTAHLGLRFDPAYRGPGLRVRDCIEGGPADRQANRIRAGQIVLAIDGRNVDPAMDLTEVLNGPGERDIRLTVRDAKDKTREVVLRPINYDTARELLYESWVRATRRRVEEQSKGQLGYVHIRRMMMDCFYRFERDIYAAGAGHDGLVIDVRENPGGFIADHLLTVLCQPRHAITVGRGGEVGYPQDRNVYATWHKPIIVLCNQNSYSNAEIFSHAVKTLGRGKLVGVQTAGGVISTGATRIMDIGMLRVPFRGWFLPNGQDMELNGAMPDYVVWPKPCEMPSGVDRQLDKAIEVLGEEVASESAKPRPKVRKASER